MAEVEYEDDKKLMDDSEEEEEQKEKKKSKTVVLQKPRFDGEDHFPCCIVWSPIPMLTWFLPMFGHFGICDSKGYLYDFSGPYTITKDQFLFGVPTRYVFLDPKKIRTKSGSFDEQVQKWDEGVSTGIKAYKKKMYNFFLNNCHHFVARCLNEMQYDGRKDWSFMELAFFMFLNGKHISPLRSIWTWCPFLSIVTLALLLILGIFLVSVFRLFK